MIRHALAALVLLAGPAAAQNLGEWPKWKKENRDALAKIVQGQDPELSRKLLSVLDEVEPQVEEAARKKREEFEPKAAAGDGEAAAMVVKVGRRAQAKLAFWEGNLVRRLLKEVAHNTGRCAVVAALPIRVSEDQFKAVLRANDIGTQEADERDIAAFPKDDPSFCPAPAVKAKDMEAAGREIAEKAKAFFKGTGDEKTAEKIVEVIVAHAEEGMRMVKEETAREKVAAIQAEIAGKLSSSELALEKARIERARDLHYAYIWGNLLPRKIIDRLGGAVPSYLREDWGERYSRSEYEADLAADPVKGAWSAAITKGTKNNSQPLDPEI